VSEWKPINLMDVVGMASNPVNPGTKFAKRLLNVYTHEKPGALTLRPGYAPKYTAPSNSTITNSSFINFGVFFDRQADPDGQEIICEIQKGTVVGLNNGGTPIVADTMNGFWFWARPSWTGLIWNDIWDWVNKTIITKITAIDGTYLSHLEIFGNATHGLGDDSLIGWTVYNKTKNQFAKIITCKLNSPDLTINITLYNNSWEVDDVLIISKCWIDIDAQTEYYNNVEKEDIVFHRINHDLRIGFGGFENRPGLMIGYRKKAYSLRIVDFTNLHSDITAGAISAFSSIERIILEPTTINEADKTYTLSLEMVGSGSLSAGPYYFRLTALIDGYQEQMVAENNIEISINEDINVNTFIKNGKDVQRVTELKIYKSTDGITFYHIRTIPVKTDEHEATNWGLDENNRLYLLDTFELHSESNAVSTILETNSVGSWVGYNRNLSAIGTPGANSTAYYIETARNVGEQNGAKLQIPGILEDTNYRVRFYIRLNALTSGGDKSFTLAFITADEYIIPFGFKILYVTNFDTWEAFDEILYSSNLVGSTITHIALIKWNTQIWFDEFRIQLADATSNYNSTIVDGAEMPLQMGYNPTYNLVKGWDQALDGGNGRIYYLNPYIEKRYENYLVVSHIYSNGSYMRDIASFSNFRELEKYDSNETIAIELLPNKQILILKDSSVTSLADDGLVGVMREPIYGFDCVSRNSVVNINGLIFFCGKEEIYLINIGSSLIPKALLKNTIRDLYLAIEDKTKILGTRNRFNTYRIRVNDSTQKIEYLLSDEGWVEERKWNFPEIYRTGFNNKLYFLSDGTIYEESVDFTLPELPYGQVDL